MAGPLEIAIGDNLTIPIAFKWLVVIGTTISTTIQIQDFRDRDLQEGRRTIPIALEDLRARWVTSIVVLAWSCILPSIWGANLGAYVAPLVLGFIMAKRLVIQRSILEDKTTFRFWGPWIVSFLCIPAMRSYA